MQHLAGLDGQSYPEDELAQLPASPPWWLQCVHACGMGGLGRMARALFSSGIAAISEIVHLPFCFVTA